MTKTASLSEDNPSLLKQNGGHPHVKYEFRHRPYILYKKKKKGLKIFHGPKSKTKNYKNPCKIIWEETSSTFGMMKVKVAKLCSTLFNSMDCSS